jgi:hypothetical protein
MGGGGRVARRCLREEDGLGLWFSGALPGSGVGRSRGEIDGDGDPGCGFCPRDGGGGGGRLRRELWSGGDLTGINGSVGSSNGVGEGRRPTGCLELSRALLLPG